MSESPFSPLWYRCAELRPRLRSHVRIHRHEYRDELWFVLEEPSSGRYHRFTPAANHIIGCMNGERTIDQIWRGAVDELGENAPTQSEMIQLLAQLHNADVLQMNVDPDVRELFERRQRRRLERWKRSVGNPLAVRIPLVDPERFLVAALPLVRPLFGWLGVALWLSVVTLGLAALVTEWTDISENFVDRTLSVENLLVLWLVYPAVKLLHELGHAFAAKRWGGEVHEIGIMLLVLFPVPYVDASSASAFASKRERIVVGAAGILVELFLAAAALLVWVSVEPGLVSAIAFNVMLIGGVSTLLFNGNPLLRFDGYYVLADALEIPNLATRSKRFIGYLVQRYLFGVDGASSPALGRGERAWLVGYGVASFAYRMFIMFVIAVFVAGKYFVIGVLLAIWAVLMTVVIPLAKMLWYLLTSPRLARNRARAVLVSAVAAAAVVAVLFAVPIPLWTRGDGVVWVPDDAQVRAGTEGLIVDVVASPGSLVSRGQALVATEDPLVTARIRLAEARLRELEARLTQHEFVDRTHAQIVRQEIVGTRAELVRIREREAALIVRAPVDGIFVLAGTVDMVGRHVRRGDLLGFVRDDGATTVRVLVDQEDIGLVRERTHRIGVVLAPLGFEPVAATLRRAVPAASDVLPTAALGQPGGGVFTVDPRDPSGLRTVERLFQLDVVLSEEVRDVGLGTRAYVRFDHGREAPGHQLLRALRQLFLSQFRV